MARRYIADLPGGTATTSIQIQQKQTLKKAVFSYLSAAAGKIELSLSPTSQIGTAQPTSDVIARLNTSATAGNLLAQIDMNVPVVPFQTVYIHQTGAGNLGNVSIE